MPLVPQSPSRSISQLSTCCPVVPPPPPPPQRSPSCWSPTSHCCSAAPLPAAAAAPSLNLPPPAPPCSPDIIGDEGELLYDDPHPPTMMAVSCRPTIRYDSKELIVDDSDESVKSCSSTAIDRLPNRDQVGVEEVLLDDGENNGFMKASSLSPMCMTIQELCFRARREALECIPAALDFSETFYSYGVKAIVIYYPRRLKMRGILGIHEVDEGAINALVVHHHIWSVIGFIECRKVGETSLGNIASLSTSRVSAKQRSCIFDPGGSTSQHFARDWKKIAAFIGLKTATIQMCTHPQKYVLKVQKSGIHEHLLPPSQKLKASHPYPQNASKIDRVLSQGRPLLQGIAVVPEMGF